MNELERIRLFLKSYRELKDDWFKKVLEPSQEYYYQKQIRILVKLGKHPHPEESLSLVDK
tara:strand:+ start:7853 stop:8032 length:180 start_codon:yes stop_codon:yes gene_type:complete